MQPTQDFTRRHLRIDSSSTAQQTEWFHDVFRRDVVQLETEPCADAPFSFETTIRALPGLMVSRTTMSPMIGRRRKQEAGDDALMLTFVVAGQATLMRNGDEMPMAAGAGTYSRYGAEDSQGAFGMQTGATILALRLSRRLIAPLIPDYDNLQRQVIPAGTEAARLLIAYLGALENEEAIIAPEAQRLVIDHASDLTALAIAASRDGIEVAARSLAAGRIAVIKSYILNNLASRDLSAITVAAQQGITPRYLRMLFEAEGTTFSEYVIAQRLMRAYRMLCDPRFAGHSISDIALRVGFGDLSHFNRTFRRRYRMTPSDARARAQSLD